MRSQSSDVAQGPLRFVLLVSVHIAMRFGSYCFMLFCIALMAQLCMARKYVYGLGTTVCWKHQILINLRLSRLALHSSIDHRLYVRENFLVLMICMLSFLSRVCYNNDVCEGCRQKRSCQTVLVALIDRLID